MTTEYNRSAEQKSFILDNNQFTIYPDKISHYTRYKELDGLLSEQGGFQLGRSYLITGLEHHPSIDVLREVFLGSSIENILHIAYTGQGLIINNEQCKFILVSEFFDPVFTLSNLIAKIEEHPDKKLILINQFDAFLQLDHNEEDLRSYIRELRAWCNRTDRTLVIYAPMGKAADELRYSYPVAWPKAIFNGGFYKWSRMLDAEFDTVLLVNPSFKAVEFYRGKHRSPFQGTGFDSILIERDFTKEILELGEWLST